LGIDGHVSVFGQLEGSVAKILESRLDDGDRDDGRIRAEVASLTVDIPAAVPAAPAYVDTTLYDVVFRF